jgi:glycerophosphoryl diester phosphodiesterase
LLIEVKYGSSVYPGIEQRIVETIKVHRAEGWCVVISFKDEVLHKVHELAPELRKHKLFLGKLPFTSLLVNNLSFEISNINDLEYVESFNPHYAFTTSALIDKAHEMGKQVNVWTVNKREHMEGLKALGVDGIITDFPDVGMGVKRITN